MNNGGTKGIMSWSVSRCIVEDRQGDRRLLEAPAVLMDRP